MEENLPAIRQSNLPSFSDSDITSLLAQAIEKGTPVETIERLLAVRRELKLEAAKEAFDQAMAAFQAECPIIKKTKAVTTNSGQVAYRYAPIESIVSQTKELREKYGFSYAIDTHTEREMVTAICIVKHQLGHSEQSTFSVPLGQKTALMNDSQVVAAALTFATRRAFSNAFGVLTGEDDTDGRVVERPKITPLQKEELLQLLSQSKFNESQILKRYKVATLNDLDANIAENLIAYLKDKGNE